MVKRSLGILAILGALLAAVLLVLALLGTSPVTPHQPVSSSTLIPALENVKTADGYRYSVVDDKNVSMDALKIIPDPQGGYLGIYHQYINGILQVRLAMSPDLLHWIYKITLDDDTASQGTIEQLTNNSFLVIYEKGEGNSNLEFRYYADRKSLLSNKPDRHRTIIVPRSQSDTNEGTPNIISASLNPDIQHSVIKIGFHFRTKIVDLVQNQFVLVDREAVGTLTNFNLHHWKTQQNILVNDLFDNIGTISGNIGDRDLFYHAGMPYELIEAQYVLNDFSSWRPFLYDMTLGTLNVLNLSTLGGSNSFGNPTYTELVLPNGKYGFVSTEFVFSESSAPGEAGELIYYRAFSPPSDDTAKQSNSIIILMAAYRRKLYTLSLPGIAYFLFFLFFSYPFATIGDTLCLPTCLLLLRL